MGKSWQRHPSPGWSLLGNLADCQSPTGWPQLWPVLSLGLHSGTQPYPKHIGDTNEGKGQPLAVRDLQMMDLMTR